MVSHTVLKRQEVQSRISMAWNGSDTASRWNQEKNLFLHLLYKVSTETIRRAKFEAQISGVTTAKLSSRKGILWYISVQDIIEVIIMRLGDDFARFFIIMF